MHLAESFRTARWIRIINLLLQAVLFLSLFAGLNYVAQNHFGRFDLTKARRYSLSAETRSYLAALAQPVRIYVTFRDDTKDEELDQAYSDLRGLLREYVYVTRNNDEQRRITVDFVDVYKNPKQAQALGIEQADNAVIVTSGERRRLITIDELYRIKNKKTREAFRGEATLTAAILDVTASERKKIYFVLGHGEVQPDDVSERGLSQLRDALRQRNYELGALDLPRARKIPDDAALLLVVGPTRPFQRFEEELLRDYLQTRAGRIVLMLDPGKQHGLDILLFDWGIIAYDDVIYDPSAAASAEGGEILISNYAEKHPVTETLLSNQMAVLIGWARTVAADPGAPVEDGIKVLTLAATSANAWGERGYRSPGLRQYTPGQDLRGNLGVLTISERVKPANLPLSVPGGRLAVFGTSDLITNNRIITLGNLTLFLNTVNWAAERDVDLNIPARPIERFQLALSKEELDRLRLGLLLVVPGAVALLGLIVYWTRRS